MSIEERILARTKEFANEIWLEYGGTLTRCEAWSMACQELQVEFQGKQCIYLSAIQIMLSDILKERKSEIPT